MRVSALNYDELIGYAYLGIWIAMASIILTIAFSITAVRTQVRCICGAIWKEITEYGCMAWNSILESGICKYFCDVWHDACRYTLMTYNGLSLTWYITTGMTIIPMCYHIPKHLMVIFLLMYCISAALVCIFGVRKPKKSLQPCTTKVQSEFFLGMKISIQ